MSLSNPSPKFRNRHPKNINIAPMIASKLQPQPGKLHRYASNLVAFEHETAVPLKHLLLWVGGLGDGLLTVPYPSTLSKKLPPGWALAEVSLLSSLHGWGTGSLHRDAKEIGHCVEYFRQLLGDQTKIVLMGHSTGCQDAMEYVTGKDKSTRPPIDGVVLQAPVSDRQAVSPSSRSTYDKIVSTAKQWVKEGRSEEVLPNHLGHEWFGSVAVTAYRWLSLLSPDKDGDDDYFSSDLSDEQLKATFGTFPESTPLLVLCSGADEHVPFSIDVPSLIKRWWKHVEDGGGLVDKENGGIVQKAHHNLAQDDAVVVDDLCWRVHGFLEALTLESLQKD